METGVSVSVQRISTVTMKVIGVISLVFACVAARGSGPYLPSGWKPDGPAFFLPSEVSKPLKEPAKEIVINESEASGTDFLREYGPPKVQEISQDISLQGLPDIVNEQLFVVPAVEPVAKENYDEVTKLTEKQFEVKSDVKSVEEPTPVTESELISGTEITANIEEEALQVTDETTTLDAVHEFGYLVEPTVAIVVPIEKIVNEAIVQSENQVTKDIAVETQKVIKEQQESVQSVRQDVESGQSVLVQSISGTEKTNIDVSEPAQSSSVESATIIDNANFDIISTVTETIKTVEEEVTKEVVQNIPELIVSLENEVKSQQAETIQEVPVQVIKEIFGSVDQVPEGFLEYGPPGFTEYGPPNEDLRDNTIEKIPETNSINNFVRRRRFSPKLRTGKRVDDPPDGKWLSSPMDTSNTKSITDALPAWKREDKKKEPPNNIGQILPKTTLLNNIDDSSRSAEAQKT